MGWVMDIDSKLRIWNWNAGITSFEAWPNAQIMGVGRAATMPISSPLSAGAYCHAPDIFCLFFFLFFPLLQDVKTFSSDYDHQNIWTPLFIADPE